MKGPVTIRKVIGKVHLWLGLGSGLVVFIVAITGCVYAFQKEIQDLTQPFRFVEKQSAGFLPPSVLKAEAEKHLPDKHMHAIQYFGPERAAMVIYYSGNPAYYYLIYINPYTAEVLEVRDMDNDFFAFVLKGHFYLWLPPQIGKPVVASSTLVFVCLLISGLILWWPRRKKDVKQRLTIKWNARWRRVNYDVHSVLGFYAHVIALILALTGLVWGFEWFAQGWYRVAGGEKSLQYAEPLSDTTMANINDVPSIDRVYAEMKKLYPTAEAIEVHIPVGKESVVAANANHGDGTYWQLDYRYFDQYTLKKIAVDHLYGRFQDATVADRIMRMNYDIHTGAILGFAGKLLVFCASLICASLPVTGVYLWLGRRKKRLTERARPAEQFENRREMTLEI